MNKKEVSEVVLSGGDPLPLSDKKISKILNKIEVIGHIKTVRFHTSTAVVIPSRISQELVKMLNKTRLKVVFVFHINHPREISD
jgi:L-lysine 2,3-aminomutase